MIRNFIGVLFDGVAYGSLLFLISIGLSVTMGLMNFVNLAHGAFAMVGGYVCVLMMTRLGVPFLADAAGRVRRDRAGRHACSSARSTSACTRPTHARPGAVLASASCSCRSRRRRTSSVRRSSRCGCPNS